MSTDDHALRKHSVKISGHSTSVSVENIFWREIENIAQKRHISLNSLIMEIDATRKGSLSGAIRIFAMKNRQIIS